MSADPRIREGDHWPGGSQVRLIGGTFDGWLGWEATKEELREMAARDGRNDVPAPPGCTTVVLILFGRPVAIDLGPEQFERLDSR